MSIFDDVRKRRAAEEKASADAEAEYDRVTSAQAQDFKAELDKDLKKNSPHLTTNINRNIIHIMHSGGDWTRIQAIGEGNFQVDESGMKLVHDVYGGLNPRTSLEETAEFVIDWCSLHP